MLIQTTLVVWIGLTVILVSGQCVQMKTILMHLDLNRWASLLSMALIVMLEATLPLALLVACVWVFSRLKEQNIGVVLASSTRDPRRILIIPLMVGVCSTILMHPIVTETGPKLINEIAELTKEAAISAVIFSSENDTLVQRSNRRLHTDTGTVDWFVGRTRGEENARLGRIESMASSWDNSGPHVTFGRAEYWGDDILVNVKSGVVRLDPMGLIEHAKVLTGPNSVVSTELTLGNEHHHFVYHRRLSMIGAIPFWMVLGSLFGLTLGRLWALSCATGLIGVSYWILRTGELACRADQLSPILAAWLPTALIALTALVLLVSRGKFAL